MQSCITVAVSIFKRETELVSVEASVHILNVLVCVCVCCQCSVPCGVGQRSREVHCVSNVGDIVEDEECNMKLRPSDMENCDAGPCTKSWFFSEWSAQVSHAGTRPGF